MGGNGYGLSVSSSSLSTAVRKGSIILSYSVTRNLEIQELPKNDKTSLLRKKTIKFYILKNNRRNQIFFSLKRSYREYCIVMEESICYRQKAINRIETSDSSW